MKLEKLENWFFIFNKIETQMLFTSVESFYTKLSNISLIYLKANTAEEYFHLCVFDAGWPAIFDHLCSLCPWNNAVRLPLQCSYICDLFLFPRNNPRYSRTCQSIPSILRYVFCFPLSIIVIFFKKNPVSSVNGRSVGLPFCCSLEPNPVSRLFFLQ